MSNGTFSKDKKLAICGCVCAVLILGGIYIVKNQIASRLKPVIEIAKINERTLTIIPASEENRLVYCVTESINSSNCDWGNSREFNLEHDGTYYSFIKNLDTGAVSDPFEMPYKYIDFSKLGL